MKTSVIAPLEEENVRLKTEIALLHADATARQRGENLDGSARRETGDVSEEMIDAALAEAGSAWGDHLQGGPIKRKLMRAALEAALAKPAHPVPQPAEPDGGELADEPEGRFIERIRRQWGAHQNITDESDYARLVVLASRHQNLLDCLRAERTKVAALLAALKGVVRIADRKTDEFDAARGAIAEIERPTLRTRHRSDRPSEEQVEAALVSFEDTLGQPMRHRVAEALRAALQSPTAAPIRERCPACGFFPETCGNGPDCPEAAPGEAPDPESASDAEVERPPFKAYVPDWAKWCQPGDKQDERIFLLRFDDTERGDMIFTDEAEAREAWGRATSSWNCYLFGALPLATLRTSAPPAQPSEALSAAINALVECSPNDKSIAGRGRYNRALRLAREAYAATVAPPRETEPRPVEDRWQPIATAPKDGTPIILWHRLWSCPPSIGYYHEGSSWWRLGDNYRWLGVGIDPTHWQPLPAAPGEPRPVEQTDVIRREDAVNAAFMVHDSDQRDGSFSEGFRAAADDIATTIRGLPSVEQTGSGDAEIERLVDRFADALKDKLYAAQRKGKTGWSDPNWQEECQRALLDHLPKGDPLDVAAYSAFMWWHSWPTVGDNTEALRLKAQSRDNQMLAFRWMERHDALLALMQSDPTCMKVLHVATLPPFPSPTDVPDALADLARVTAERDEWKIVAEADRIELNRLTADANAATQDDAPPSVRDGGEVEQAARRLVQQSSACVYSRDDVLTVARAALANTAPATGQGDEKLRLSQADIERFKRFLAVNPPHLRNPWFKEPSKEDLLHDLEVLIAQVKASTHPAPKIESPRDLAAVRWDRTGTLGRSKFGEYQVHDYGAAEHHYWLIYVSVAKSAHETIGKFADKAAAQQAASDHAATLDAAPAPEPASAGETSHAVSARLDAEMFTDPASDLKVAAEAEIARLTEAAAAGSDVAGLRALSEKATQGPWNVSAHGGEAHEIDIENRGWFLRLSPGWAYAEFPDPNDVREQHEANASFIVTCVNHVRAALAASPDAGAGRTRAALQPAGQVGTSEGAK